jgi:tetratricopeptide (TPR) repeat protein
MMPFHHNYLLLHETKQKYMHIRKLLLCTFTLLATLGCNQPNGFDRVMNRADSIMEADQDNAKKSLMILDKMKPQLSEISKAQRMRYNLLYAKAMNKGYVDFTSDSIMKDVTAYYDHHGSDNDKLMAHYLLGCVYRDMGDAPSAINCFNDATEYAGKDKNSYLMLCCIHGQIADLLEKQTLDKEYLKELDLTAHYAWLAGDTLDAISCENSFHCHADVYKVGI